MIFVDHEIAQTQFDPDKADLTGRRRGRIQQRSRTENIRCGDERDALGPCAPVERRAKEQQSLLVRLGQSLQALAMFDDVERIAQAAAQEP